MNRARTVVAIAAAFALASCADAGDPMGPETAPGTPGWDGPPGVSYAIAFESFSVGSSDDEPRMTIDRPPETEEGDFLLAQIAFEDGSDITVTPPQGWAFPLQTNQGSDVGQAFLWKIAGGDEPDDYDFEFSDGVEGVGAILRYSGVDAESPVIAVMGRIGDGSTPRTGSLTIEEDATLVAMWAMSDETNPGSVGLANSRVHAENPDDDWSIRAADEEVGPGTHGDFAWTLHGGDDKWVAQLVALRMAVDDDEPAETSTTLTVDPEDESEFGETITLTAHVTTNGDDVTEGQVAFRWGGTDCTDGTLVATEDLDADGEASTSFSDLAVGEYVFRACYLGTDDFEVSQSDDVDHEVVKAATSTSLEVDPEDESTFGDEITLTATVTRDHDGAAVDEGSVTFQYGGESCDDTDAVDIATEAVDGDGAASTSISTLASGDYVFRACYGGSDSYEASDSDDVTHKVFPLFNIVVFAVHGGGSNGFIVDPESAAVNFAANQGTWSISFYVKKDHEEVTDACPADLAELDISMKGLWTKVGSTEIDPPDEATAVMVECENRGSMDDLRIVKLEIENVHEQGGPPTSRVDLEGNFKFTVEDRPAGNDVAFEATNN